MLYESVQRFEKRAGIGNSHGYPFPVKSLNAQGKCPRQQNLIATMVHRPAGYSWPVSSL